MSVMNHRGEKIVLAQGGIDQFWFDVLRYYGRHNDKRWRALAMLALRVNGRWPLECIARTFGLERRHVAIYLMRIRRDLRAQFEVPASILMALIGYAIGNYAALIAAQLCRLVAGA